MFEFGNGGSFRGRGKIIRGMTLPLVLGPVQLILTKLYLQVGSALKGLLANSYYLT